MVGRALITGAVIAGLACVAPAAPAQAKGVCGTQYTCEWTYYNTVPPYQIVGTLYIYCYGGSIETGIQTANYEFVEIPC